MSKEAQEAEAANAAKGEETKAPAQKEPVVKDSENGVTRPGAGTKTGRVWEISDAISEASGAPALRAPVLEQCSAEEINAATAATQYGRWRRYHGLQGTGRPEVAKKEKTPEVPAEPKAPAVKDGEAGVE